MNYLIYQIGCIECGVPSYPIGLVDTEEQAKSIAESYPSTWTLYGGDGYIEIIPLAEGPEFPIGIDNVQAYVIKFLEKKIKEQELQLNGMKEHETEKGEKESEAMIFLYDRYTEKIDILNKCLIENRKKIRKA
tara:strand:+ start:321 stop:719 length:399 start_codon:yes stop_codon:yes gene_type:complete